MPGVRLLKMGLATTPARPASSTPSTHAAPEERPGSTPRMRASAGRSTVARMERPSRVRRSTSHSATEAAAAATNVATWLLSRFTPLMSV